MRLKHQIKKLEQIKFIKLENKFMFKISTKIINTKQSKTEFMEIFF